MKDYYQILGVNKNATDDEIKKAYRRLAMKHHPDRGGNSDYFQEINTAYETLADPAKRAHYDNPIHEQINFSQGDFDLNSMFDMFSTRMHARQSRESRVGLWLSLEDVARGGNRIMTLSTPNGVIPVEISIPKGVQDGESVRYPKILPGAADLVVGFRINKHAFWQREGLDLWCEKSLDFWQLILGTEVEIKDILNNTINLKVPPRTKPGSSLRLKGKGLQRQRHNTGDVFVKIKAVMPNDIPDEIVDILQKNTVNK